jgi:hypothetical protein
MQYARRWCTVRRLKLCFSKWGTALAAAAAFTRNNQLLTRQAGPAASRPHLHALVEERTEPTAVRAAPQPTPMKRASPVPVPPAVVAGRSAAAMQQADVASAPAPQLHYPYAAVVVPRGSLSGAPTTTAGAAHQISVDTAPLQNIYAPYGGEALSSLLMSRRSSVASFPGAESAIAGPSVLGSMATPRKTLDDETSIEGLLKTFATIGQSAY